VALERGAWETPARRTPTHELLVTLLGQKTELSVERLFRLIGLLHPREDLLRIYRAIGSSDPKTCAGGLELLGSLLEPPVREAVLGLVDGGDDARRLAFSAPFHAPSSPLYASVLNQILNDGGTALPALAAWHIGELGLSDLRGELLALEPGAPRLLKDAIARALTLLGPMAADKVVHA